jgi:hypothetical protein
VLERRGMANEILRFIETTISKVLETLFDEIEYRLARRAFRDASKVGTKVVFGANSSSMR